MIAAIKFPALHVKAHSMIVKTSYVAVSTAIGFVGGEVMNLNGLLSAGIGLLTAVIIALIGKQPAMRQHRLTAHEQEIKWYQQRIKYNSSHEKLGRRRTHAALNEVQRLTLYAHNLVTMCKEKGIEVPMYKFKTYEDLCGEFDEQMTALEFAESSENA